MDVSLLPCEKTALHLTCPPPPLPSTGGVTLGSYVDYFLECVESIMASVNCVESNMTSVNWIVAFGSYADHFLDCEECNMRGACFSNGTCDCETGWKVLEPFMEAT